MIGGFSDSFGEHANVDITERVFAVVRLCIEACSLPVPFNFAL